MSILEKLDQATPTTKKIFNYAINHCGVESLLTPEQVRVLDTPIPKEFIKKRKLSKTSEKSLKYIPHGFVEYILDAVFGKGNWKQGIIDISPQPDWAVVSKIMSKVDVLIRGTLHVKINGEWHLVNENFGSHEIHVTPKDGKISLSMTWGFAVKSALSDLLKRTAMVGLGVGRALAMENSDDPYTLNIQQFYPSQPQIPNDSEDESILRFKVVEMVLDSSPDIQGIIKERLIKSTPPGTVPYTFQTMPIDIVKKLFTWLNGKGK